MPAPPSNDPLHGVTLETIVTELVEAFGWEDLGQRVRIRCFNSDPSIRSSLKFLRKTPWAREKVESLYLYMLRERRRHGGDPTREGALPNQLCRPAPPGRRPDRKSTRLNSSH